MNFDKIYNQAKIEVTLTVQRSLVVGSGQGDISPTGVDIPQIKLTQFTDDQPLEVPYIPGSSLKGAIRSVCETLVRTYLGSDRALVCYDDTPEERGCRRASKDVLCMMCDTFGSTDRMSKVFFDDAFLTDESAANLLEAVQHRTGITISRKTGAVKTGALYKVEFVPKGTTFRFNILCTNILASELKLMLLAMRLFNEGRFKLGGQKSRGMGAIEFDLNEVTVYLPKLYRYAPFVQADDGWRWLETLPADLGECVVLEVAEDDWEAILQATGRVTRLVQRLYPVAADAPEGRSRVTVALRKGTTEEIHEVGTFGLTLAGPVTGVSESGNGLEFIIQRRELTELFEQVYQSAFDFLGDVAQAVAEEEPYRALGQAGKVMAPLPLDGEVKYLTVVEGERLHTVLVWLGLARWLVEG
ncbi:MAG TPA: CRISPR-associated RAMP protein [Anaerolineae bacterium]|nr:CRISPR-associated RAMP protein [Anaerolineae bacterium]